ncbi:MAG: GAP family protein [Solirubrobacteraceae bacterium]|nr:GAP family protein [Solirubrobacteraceae bacterium]
MGDLLRTVLPLALGAAISPTIVALVTAVLASGDDAVRRATALTAGAAIPLLVIGGVLLGTVHAAGVEHGPRHEKFDGMVDLVFAVVLAGLAVRALKPAPTPQERQAERAEHAPGGTGRYVALGFGVMLVNFSTLAMFIPAVKDIVRARARSPVGEVVALLVVIVIVLIPAWGPLLLRVAFPERAARVLRPLGRWMANHQRQLGGWVAAVFAAYLLLRGVLELR